MSQLAKENQANLGTSERLIALSQYVLRFSFSDGCLLTAVKLEKVKPQAPRARSRAAAGPLITRLTPAIVYGAVEDKAHELFYHQEEKN